jgi:hypothetical protein
MAALPPKTTLPKTKPGHPRLEGQRRWTKEKAQLAQQTSSYKSNSFKYIKARYLAAACGLALAATAVIAGQPWATATVSTSAPARSVAVLRSSETPSTTVYLVADEAEKVRVTDLFAADAGARPSHVNVEVLVVDNAAKLQSVATTQLEQLEAGGTFIFTDLRPSEQTPSGSVAIGAADRASEFASVMTDREQLLVQLSDQGEGNVMSDEALRNDLLRYEEAGWALY